MDKSIKNKPVIVHLAKLYFGLISIVLISIITYIWIKEEELRVFAVLFIILAIPYILSFALLFANPKPWHHSFCSFIGNVAAFMQMFGSIWRLIHEKSFVNLVALTFFSIVLLVFLNFDFSRKSRAYFGKN